MKTARGPSWLACLLLLLPLIGSPLSAVAHPMEGSGLNVLDPTVPARMDIGVMRRGRDAYYVGFRISIYKFLESIDALKKHPDLAQLTPQSEAWEEVIGLTRKYVEGLVGLQVDGEPVAPKAVRFPELRQRGGIDKEKGDFAEVVFPVPPEAKSVTLTVNPLVESARVGVMDRQNPRKVELKKGDDHVVPLRGAAIPEAVKQIPQQQKEAMAPSRQPGAVFGRYLVLGIEHIVPKGLDHILFVLGLFLLSTRWRPLLWQVSLFTLAHTLTLGLAAAGYVSAPAHIIEPLIAFSIAWVAIENLLHDRLNAFRLLVVFAFGLLHGLGFASVLGDLGLPTGQFMISLVGFNLGVELGQLGVILGAFVLVFWARGKPFYRPWIVRPASVVIAGIGLYWGIERLLA
jgi:hypothetical protein